MSFSARGMVFPAWRQTTPPEPPETTPSCRISYDWCAGRRPAPQSLLNAFRHFARHEQRLPVAAAGTHCLTHYVKRYRVTRIERALNLLDVFGTVHRLAVELDD